MRYFFIAGEASGDVHGARAMAALRLIDPKAEISFVGGDEMAKASKSEPIVHYKDLAYMGLWQVLLHAGTINRLAKRVQEALLTFKPDIVVPIDYPGFNFRYILPFVKKNFPKTKLAYYISPKVWAWKKGRVSMLRTHTDLVLSILPFEQAFFEQEHLSHSVYVGNPSREAVDTFLASRGGATDWQKRNFINNKPVMAILSGSRTAEIKQNLPKMLKAAKKIANGCHILIAGAPGQEESLYRSIPGTDGIPILFGETFEILSRSHIALVTSGTATLETALFGTPQVVCYAHKASYLANFVFSSFFSCKYISLVNLILKRPLLSELYGGKFKTKAIVNEVQSLLKVPSKRETMLDGYKELRTILGEHDVAHNVASRLYSLAKKEIAKEENAD